MGWIVGGVWIGAAVFAVLVLAFCGYELYWKAERMNTDLRRLTGLARQVTGLRADVQEAQLRIGVARSAASSGEGEG